MKKQHMHKLTDQDLPHIFALARVKGTTNYFFCPECRSQVSGKTHPIADRQIIDFFNQSCGQSIEISQGRLRPKLVAKDLQKTGA